MHCRAVKLYQHPFLSNQNTMMSDKGVVKSNKIQQTLAARTTKVAVQLAEEY
jgi:hypothetical protein